MAETHVMSALKSKRAELAGLVVHLKRQAAMHEASIAMLDGTIRLFASADDPPTFDPAAIRTPERRFSNGELSRAILDAMRKAGEPATASALGDAVMAAKGINPAEAAAVRKSIQQTLLNQKRRGVLSSSEQGGVTLWSVV